MINKKALAVSVALKLSLILLLLVALIIDAKPFQGKAIWPRLVFYPLLGSVVMIVWGVLRLLGKKPNFPYRADILVTMPFLLDTLGNWLNLFDKISWWDDLMHFSNWFILMLGLSTVLIGKTNMAAWQKFLLVAGVGALFAIYWELGEYFFFVQSNPMERATAYRDTIGDLVGGSSGGALGGLLEIAYLSRRQLSPDR